LAPGTTHHQFTAVGLLLTTQRSGGLQKVQTWYQDSRVKTCEPWTFLHQPSSPDARLGNLSQCRCRLERFRHASGLPYWGEEL